jgi:hypothetical protein
MGLRKGTAIVLCQAVSGRTHRQPTHGISVCCGHKFLIWMRKSHILLCEQCGSNCTDLCGKPIVSWIKDWNSRPGRNCSGFLLSRCLFQMGVVEEEAVITLQTNGCRWGQAAWLYLIMISFKKLESIFLTIRTKACPNASSDVSQWWVNLVVIQVLSTQRKKQIKF